MARRTGQRVIAVGDDADVPISGTVTGWLDDERCTVDWGDGRGRAENADELSPYDRRLDEAAGRGPQYHASQAREDPACQAGTCAHWYSADETQRDICEEHEAGCGCDWCTARATPGGWPEVPPFEQEAESPLTPDELDQIAGGWPMDAEMEAGGHG